MSEVRFSVAVPSTERLDRFLADQLQLSRTQAARIVAAKSVTVNGAIARASRALVVVPAADRIRAYEGTGRRRVTAARGRGRGISPRDRGRARSGR